MYLLFLFTVYNNLIVFNLVTPPVDPVILKKSSKNLPIFVKKTDQKKEQPEMTQGKTGKECHF